MKKFDFWKDNLKAGLYQLTAEEFLAKLKEYLFTKEVAWLEYYGSKGTVYDFIGNKDGLSSVADKVNELVDLVVNDKCVWNHIETIKALKPLLESRVKVAPEKLSLWGMAIQTAMESKSDISGLVKALISQYKDNPESMTRILGEEAANVMLKLIPATVQP